jgi:hypothetical protein
VTSFEIIQNHWIITGQSQRLAGMATNVPRSAGHNYVLREAHRLLELAQIVEDSTGSLTDSAPVRNI